MQRLGALRVRWTELRVSAAHLQITGRSRTTNRPNHPNIAAVIPSLAFAGSAPQTPTRQPKKQKAGEGNSRLSHYPMGLRNLLERAQERFEVTPCCDAHLLDWLWVRWLLRVICQNPGFRADVPGFLGRWLDGVGSPRRFSELLFSSSRLRPEFVRCCFLVFIF